MKEVKVKMTVDSTQAQEGVDNVTGSVDKLSGGAATMFKSFTAGLKSIAAGFRTVGGAIALSGLGLLVITIGAISAAFKGSEEGQNKFAKIMGVIGAVTGNLVDVLADLGDLLIDAFENPQQSLKSFGKLIKDNVVNRFEGLLELLPQLGKAIGLLFEGEFTEAGKVAGNAMGKVALGVEDVTGKFKDATNAVGDFIEQNKTEAAQAAKVADMRAKADKVERGLLVRRAKAEREIAELRVKAKDVNNTTAKEREEALKKVMKLQDSLIGSEQEVANLRRDAQTFENSFARSTKENLETEERLKAEAIAVETRRLNQKRTIQRELSTAENEIAREEKEKQKVKEEEQKVKDEAEKVRLKALSDYKNALKKKNEDLDATTEEEKLELERTRAEEELKRLIGTDEEKREALLLLNEFYDQKEDELANKRSEEKSKRDEDDAKKEIDTAKKVADAKKGIQDATLNTISGGISLLKKLGEDSKALQATALIAEAGVGVAKMIIGKNTADLADTAHAATLGPVAGPAYLTSKLVLNKVNLGIGLASTALATTKGLQALGKGGSVDRGDDSQGGGSGASAPSFNLVEGSEGNQIQNSIQNVNETPLRAYVVAQDVTSQQSLDRQIESNSGI
tara:strand:+ start:4332 stop:6203 length:1872 start_codon:yes stop_codon:yes gene_type:complete